MTKYKHLFFDLDRTLWDFETNAIITLREVYDRNHLKEKGIDSFEDFVKTYKKINEELWTKYRKGEIEKEFLRNQRFNITLQKYGIVDEKTAEAMGTDYITLSPQKTGMFPNSIEVIKALKNAGYKLHIITNGFKEVQFVKLKNCGLDKYFDTVIVSEEVGFKKPDVRVFEASLKKANAKKEESLMIGDDLSTDISGAMAFGMDSVWVNYNNEKSCLDGHMTVTSMLELKDLLCDSF